ncbi:Ribokinase-like protein [Mrakia frigida]|uniref:Ribokinase-like protein n=1 Tax=Mrakia frigida TaxID=29902 RepID=UPI003FCC0895
MSSPPVLTSIGTVLIDCFTFLNADGSETKPPLHQIGGGGLYCIIGSRLWLRPEETRILVDTEEMVENRPAQFEDLRVKFGEEMWAWRTSYGASVKALIEYKGKERSFRYETPPNPITPYSFVCTPLVQAKYLHLVSSPLEALSTSAAFESIASSASTSYEGKGWKPRIVWEPHPMFCKPEYLEDLIKAMAVVDVLSPNHDEAAALLSLPPPSTPAEFASLLQTFLDFPTLPLTTSVVLRCGALGACVGTRSGGVRWVPAYWKEEEKEEVRDVTGAGNSFLGGLIAGLEKEGGDIFRAAAYACVSASFVVQQFGLPELVTTVEGEERWNGDLPKDRLEKLWNRMDATSSSSSSS